MRLAHLSSLSEGEAVQAALIDLVWEVSGLSIPIRLRVVSVGPNAIVELDLCNDVRLEYSRILEAFMQRQGFTSHVHRRKSAGRPMAARDLRELERAAIFKNDGACFLQIAVLVDQSRADRRGTLSRVQVCCKDP